MLALSQLPSTLSGDMRGERTDWSSLTQANRCEKCTFKEGVQRTRADVEAEGGPQTPNYRCRSTHSMADESHITMWDQLGLLLSLPLKNEIK
ncbi:Hypothetical predicted protein [Scomber scombrus]|uniref:Uncharacterized protein n=1 Tax=Scomber scombrus TaxID=13677 RepID=A0AAV1MS83_SCOSC